MKVKMYQVGPLQHVNLFATLSAARQFQQLPENQAKEIVEWTTNDLLPRHMLEHAARGRWDKLIDKFTQASVAPQRPAPAPQSVDPIDRSLDVWNQRN